MSTLRRVVVVTGLYGAGKSTALQAMSELGYFCIDNLPTAVVESAVRACEDAGINRTALGIHVGSRGDVKKGAAEIVDRLGTRTTKPPMEGASKPPEEARSREVTVLFLDASDAALVRRFNETRRPHPLLAGAAEATPLEGEVHRPGTSAVLDGVRLERERLAPLRARATFELDTSSMSVHDLRRQVLGFFDAGTESGPRMKTRFVSFGFKYGMPIDANLVFDVRFLDNPYFVPELRPLTGLDPKVRDHIFRSEDANEFAHRVTGLLEFCLPRYQDEGKSYLTVGIGCTGGQHRSVALAEELAKRLRAAGLKGGSDSDITVVHRDAGHRGGGGTRP